MNAESEGESEISLDRRPR